MADDSLYIICKVPITQALEAWDANDIDPIIVFGPASLFYCEYEISVRFRSPEYYIAKFGEVE